MNHSETATLLAMIQAFDRRTVGEADVTAWQAALDDLRFEDCRTAVVAHFRISSEWLMPAAVRAAVKAARRDRLERDLPTDPPDADPNDVPAYLEALREQRTRVGDGTERPRPVAELIAGVAQQMPRDDATCPTHPGELAANCRGCRADHLARPEEES